VSAIYEGTACVTRAGEVFFWGLGILGKLPGDTSKGVHHSISIPERVSALAGMMVKHISFGPCHTAVCTANGQVYTCGSGLHGKLGHGNIDNKTIPALVQALEGKYITQVQCGTHHTVALTSSGYVFTWGSGAKGRLGHGGHSTKIMCTPCLVEGLRKHNVVQITSSADDFCAVLVDPSPSSTRQSQQASLNNKEHYDVVFMVENEPLFANIDGLSQKSDYFRGMFRSKMRESIERVVVIPNCSKAAFLRVLEYLCLDDFTVSIDHVVELWQLADMYQLEGLKCYCIGSLERGLCKENASQILQEAEELSCTCDELKKMCHAVLLKKRNTHCEDPFPLFSIRDESR
jgi:hypothetical protein